MSIISHIHHSQQ
jgi:hypothetical protein